MPSSGAGTRNALAHSQPFGQISSCGEVGTGAERCAGVSEDAQARVYALAEHTGRCVSGVTRRSTSSNLRCGKNRCYRRVCMHSSVPWKRQS